MPTVWFVDICNKMKAFAFLWTSFRKLVESDKSEICRVLTFHLFALFAYSVLFLFPFSISLHSNVVYFSLHGVYPVREKTHTFQKNKKTSKDSISFLSIHRETEKPTTFYDSMITTNKYVLMIFATIET